MANWYVYIGGDPTLTTSYRLSTVKPSCVNGEQVCDIYMNQTDGVPVTFDNNLTTYIANALATQTAQPTGIGVKRFVYMKGSIS